MIYGVGYGIVFVREMKRYNIFDPPPKNYRLLLLSTNPSYVQYLVHLSMQGISHVMSKQPKM